jgi:hypothetical protein
MWCNKFGVRLYAEIWDCPETYTLFDFKAYSYFLDCKMLLGFFERKILGENILLHAFETDVLKCLLNKMSLQTKAFLIMSCLLVVRLRMTGAMSLLSQCACKALTRLTASLPLP